MKAIFYRDFASSYIPHIFRELYLDRVYQPYLDHFKDGVVIDCGGNIGLFTQFAVDNGAKHVYIIEPSKDHVEVINRLIEFNGIKDKVTVLPYALADKDGEMDLLHSNNVTAHSLLPGMNNAGTSERVRTVSFSTLLKENKIEHVNFFKCDPEGFEYQIIGSPSFAENVDKIDSMVVEMHQWGNYSYPQLVNTLRDYGYKVRKMPTEAYVVGCEK